MAGWQALDTVACRKNEWTAPRGENIGHRIDPLQAKIDVEDSAINPFVSDQCEGCRNLRGRPHDIVTKLGQHRFQGECNEQLILNDQETLSLG